MTRSYLTHQFSLCARIAPLAILLAVGFLLLETAYAENAVRLSCPVTLPQSPSDSCAIEVYLTNEVPLNSFTLGFWYYSGAVEITSVSEGPFLLMPNSLGMFLPRMYPADNRVSVSWVCYATEHSLPISSVPVHAFTLWIHATDYPATGCVDIDSGFVPYATFWQYTYNNSHSWIYPQFIDCDQCELVGGAHACGDSDGSGRIDVTDVVYMINYFFGGGPSPVDSYSGDYNCDSRSDISDGVHLINFIFASGQPPCLGCKSRIPLSSSNPLE